mgnify:CR=1 FL=1
MANSDGIRWQQRLENFGKALAQLDGATRLASYSELELAGLVKMFEFSFELAWKTCKDLLFHGGIDAASPREAIRQAFEAGYLEEKDAETLLDGLDQRNLLTHTYDAKAARQAGDLIKNRYAPALRRVYERLERKRAS